MTSTDKVVATKIVNTKLAFIYVSLAMLFLVMATGFYFTWQQLLVRDRQAREFQQQFESAERSQDKFLQENQALLQEQMTQFDLRIEKLNIGDRSDWLLAEAEYLLRMANQYATLAHDAKSAETLLANADQVMRELEKSIAAGKAVINIRRKIADERASLGMYSELDREGLYLQLEALIKQVDQVAVVDISSLPKKAPISEDPVATPEQSISSQMMASLLRALEKIGGYIRIQHHDQALDEPNRAPLLSPDDQTYLKQNLRLRLVQAQLALLQQNQVMYAASLNDAKSWIKKYYVIDPALKTRWLADLDTYSRQNIAQPLPDIDGSLVALRSYMATRRVFDENPAKR